MVKPERKPGGPALLRGAMLALCFLLPADAAQGPTPVQEPPSLACRLQKLLANPRYDRATLGIKVLSLDTGRTLFESNSGRYFTPASNTKLFTAALALQQLGPEFRIRTSLFASRAPDAQGVLHGDLLLFGRGDPSILGRGWGGPDPLVALAEQAWQAGLRSVEGDLVGDDSFFATPPFGSGWECEDLPYGFAAEPSALTIHDNVAELRIYPAPMPGLPCFVFPIPGFALLSLLNQTTTTPQPGAPGEGIRVSRALGDSTLRVAGSLPLGAAPALGGVTLHDPAQLFAQLLRRALLRRGIQVKGSARSLHAADRPGPLDTRPLAELGHLEAPPLRALLRATLKDSINLNAQLLFLQAGAASPGPGLNTENRSVKALHDFLQTAGINPAEVLLEEGSGLSRKNLVTPAAVVALLAHMSRTPFAGIFKDTLPLAGVDGTLKTRMAGTSAQGRVQAKTGTLRNTHSLSGYATTPAGEHLAFSILINQAPKDLSPQAELDALTVALTEP